MSLFRNALTEAELAQRDARGQRLSPPGVEAAEGIRTLDVQLGKPDGQCSKGLSEQGDTNGAELVVPKMVPSEHENAPKSGDSDRLAVIADLLADLPQAERRAVIAELVPADRAAIARLLIDTSQSTVNSKDEEDG